MFQVCAPVYQWRSAPLGARRWSSDYKNERCSLDTERESTPADNKVLVLLMTDHGSLKRDTKRLLQPRRNNEARLLGVGHPEFPRGGAVECGL